MALLLCTEYSIIVGVAGWFIEMYAAITEYIAEVLISTSAYSLTADDVTVEHPACRRYGVWMDTSSLGSGHLGNWFGSTHTSLRVAWDGCGWLILLLVSRDIDLVTSDFVSRNTPTWQGGRTCKALHFALK